MNTDESVSDNDDLENEESHAILQRVKRLTKIVMDQQQVPAEQALHDTLILDSEIQSQSKNDPHTKLLKTLNKDIDKAMTYIQSKQYKENVDKEKEILRAVLRQMPHNEYF